MELTNLIKLGKALAKANPSAPIAYSFGDEKFSYEALNDTFNAGVKDLVGDCTDYYKYEAHKNEYFQLMAEIITDVLPKRVIEQFGMFAEVKTFAQGDKPIFVQKTTLASKRRAKQFVTRVALDGVYEVFKLDGRKLEVPTSAYGAAVEVTLEEMLDGRMNLQEFLDIIMEGLNDKVYEEIQAALVATISQLGAKNKYTSLTGWEEDKFDKLLAVADSFGGGKSPIYCTFEFAAKMLPATGWVSNEMKNARWSQGYLGNYKGHSVILFEQSFTDETCTEKVIDPKYVWIIPGGAEKPIKLAFEGQAIVREWENMDASKEIHIYEKFGAASMVQNNICVYIDDTLSKQN
jgi:hypothetical protein